MKKLNSINARVTYRVGAEPAYEQTRAHFNNVLGRPRTKNFKNRDKASEYFRLLRIMSEKKQFAAFFHENVIYK